MLRFLNIIKLTVLAAFLTTVGSARAESVLNFPRLDNTPSTLTGVAVINPNDGAAAVTFTAYRTDGSLFSGAGVVNPAVRMIPGNRQLALLMTDIFGTGLAPELYGWVQATSPSPGLTGFYLFLDDATTFLDGADLPPLGRKIVFNQVRVGGGYSTELNIFNPADQRTRIDAILFDGEGIVEIDPIDFDFRIPARGVVRLDVATLFDVSEVQPGASILVVSDTNIGGFQLVRSGAGDILGLNAPDFGQQLNEIFFPQLAVLGPLRMEIGVVNYAPVSATLFITAYRPDGAPYGPGTVAQNRVVRNLGPGLALREDVASMFGFQGDEALEGWIQVESTERGVNGYVTYGFPSVGSVAAVAAPARALKRAVFPHIATTRGFFTGVAALNPSALAANVRIVALASDGVRLGSFDTVLGPGQRMSRLITDLIDESLGQAGGVIWVSSDRPLYLTALFGTLSGTVLANIPPQPVPDSYRPDAGIPEAGVEPTLAVVGLGRNADFDAPALEQPAWSLLGRGGSMSNLGMIDANGLYQSEAEAPALPVTVTARQGDRVAAATLDVVSAEDFQGGLAGVSALAYSSFNRRLYAVRGLAGGGGELLVVGNGSTQPLRAFPGEDIAALVPFRDFSGRELLLLGSRSSGNVIRYDPVDDATRNLVGGFEGITGMAFSPVTGNLVVADEAGLTEISFPLLESDFVSGLDVNGSLPRFLLVNSNIGGLAIDGCDGSIYYSHTVSGEIRRFDPATGAIEVVASGLQAPGAVLGVHRRSSSCGGSFHVLAAETDAGRISLAAGQDGSVAPWLETTAPRAMAFLESGNDFDGSEAVLVVEGAVAAAGAEPQPRVRRIPLPGLYQERSVNPLDAAPTGIVSDPVNDLFQPREVLLDMVEVAAFDDGSNLEVTVTFADPAAPARGLIDLDTDANPLTGFGAGADFNSPYATGLGVDLSIDLCEADETTGQCLYDPSPGTAGAFALQNGVPTAVATVPVVFGERSVTATIPRGLLGGEGPWRLSAVFGPAQGPSDAAPNGGFLLTERVSATAAAGLKAAVRWRAQGEGTSQRRDAKGSPAGTPPARGWVRIPR